jgi:hypothetical protein
MRHAFYEASAPLYLRVPYRDIMQAGNIYGAEVGPERLMKRIGRDDLGRAVVVALSPGRG